jgi:Uma2 family endonuclease
MTMRTEAQISEQEYLSTVYEPDCEYEDGVLIERNVGEEKHSWLQTALAAYFFQRRKRWNIEVYAEQRNQIRHAKYLVPDVCVVSGPRPSDQVFTTPPLIWIEILSPEDRLIPVNEKVRQLLEWGAPNIWVIDPETLEAEIHTQQGSRTVDDGILRVEGTPIEVPLNSLEEE